MARPAFDDEEEKPLDPAVEKVRKKLVRFVAINLGLLFIALMAVVAAIVYKARTVPPPLAETGQSVDAQSPESVIDGQIPLPAGARIASQSMSGNRISLALEMPDGGRAIYVYDMLSARVVARFAVVQE
jgi:hypothetical protein